MTTDGMLIDVRDSRPRRSYYIPETVAWLVFCDRDSVAPDPTLQVRLHRAGEHLYAWSEHGRPLDHPCDNASTAAVRKALGLMPGRWSLLRREEASCE